MPKKQRFRLRFTFWLDMLDEQEQQIAEQIDALKQERTFARTIRDGIRLIADLRAGRVNVLFELFPWVKAEFITGINQSPPPSNNSSDVSKLERQIRNLETMLLNITTPPTVATPRALAPVGGPKPLNAPKFDLPLLDDDDGETITLSRDTSSDSALNFLNSMLAIQQ